MTLFVFVGIDCYVAILSLELGLTAVDLGQCHIVDQTRKDRLTPISWKKSVILVDILVRFWQTLLHFLDGLLLSSPLKQGW